MTHNEHVYAICCRLKVDYGVISSQNLKTIEGYDVVNFEVTSSISSEIFDAKNHFVTTEAGINDNNACGRQKQQCYVK